MAVVAPVGAGASVAARGGVAVAVTAAALLEMNRPGVSGDAGGVLSGDGMVLRQPELVTVPTGAALEAAVMVMAS